MNSNNKPDPASHAARKLQMTAGFDALASTYDQLHFLRVCAERLVQLAPLADGMRVLDIATGTGVVALAAARRVGLAGSVVGIDLSPEMLAHAQAKQAQTGLSQVQFQLADAEHLESFAPDFDQVLCSSSLFFFPDILATLREWRRVLKPGGTVGFTSFSALFMQPLYDLWLARLQRHGLTAIEIPFKRLGTPEICEAYLREAGFTESSVLREQLGYYVPTVEMRWADIVAGLEGKPLQQLAPEQYAQIKAEHLEELATHITSQGIWLDVDSLFAFGRKV